MSVTGKKSRLLDACVGIDRIVVFSKIRLGVVRIIVVAVAQELGLEPGLWREIVAQFRCAIIIAPVVVTPVPDEILRRSPVVRGLGPARDTGCGFGGDKIIIIDITGGLFAPEA